MKREKISDIISNIDSKYVDKAAAYSSPVNAVPRSRWIKWGTVAACFICVFAIGLALFIPKLNDEKCGVHFLTDQEPIIVSIEKWQYEGFQCKVIDADIHKFLAEGGTLLIYFTGETKVTTLDGEEFIYDDENPNAEDCGLPTGTVVQIYFDSIEYGNDGMADRIYAKEVVPQK